MSEDRIDTAALGATREILGIALENDQSLVQRRARIQCVIAAVIKADKDTIESLQSQLARAEQRFESIRLILIKHLDEPERSAFWKAVEGRDAIRSLTEEVGKS